MSSLAAAVRERSAARALPAWAWLTLVVVASAAVQFALARRVVAPWIMVDELIYSELAKSVAATGHFLVRGVSTGSYGVVYPALIAPAFRLFGPVPAAYEAAKAVNATLVSLAAVPTFLLARRVVSERLALLAGVLAVALPSALYAGTLMTENAFYPLSLCFALALVLALERPTAPRALAVLVVFAVAFLTRAQAAAFWPAALAAPLLVGGLARFRAYWAVLVAPVALAVLAEAARGRSPAALLGAYAAATHSTYTAGSALRWLAYHAIELDVYVGVAPVVALAVLVARRRSLDERARAFVAATTALVVLLVVEVAVFAAGNIARIEERNLFYVAPLLLVALLAWIERGLPRGPVAVGAAALAALTPLALPYASVIGTQSQADTLLADAWWWLLDRGVAVGDLRWVVAGGAVALAAAALLLPVRLALALPAAILVCFALTTVVVENGRHGIHEASLGALYQGIALPRRDWVDARVGRGADVAVLHVDARNRDAFEVWQNEFFNRSVGPVYDVGVGPLPGGLPETRLRVDLRSGLLLDDGRPVRHAYALATYGYPLVGSVVARDDVRSVTLYRPQGPLRLAYRTTGVWPDTWSGPTATYRRYACAGGRVRAQVQQDRTLFPGPQTVNGVRVDAQGPVWVSAPLRGCVATFRVAPTRVPGPQDRRRLGVHLLRFVYVP